MNNLYKNLSVVYEAMYQTFIDYNEEYACYSSILKRYNCKHVLEIGCGTGHLAEKFTAGGFIYTGMDLSEDMLQIARYKNTSSDFIRGDMRNFHLAKKTNAAIITGRTISYLITNEDVLNTLKSIYTNLAPGGILCFDSIDASLFIPSIKNGKEIVHSADWKDRKFMRTSKWDINFSQSWLFDWHSEYFELKPGKVKESIGMDNSTIRTFTKDEMQLFLKLAGFTILEINNRASYAFDTFVVVAQKNISD
ncbi:MAG: class I SAM-dependent methyltransferase [Sphingobacteriales bacterium]|nr:class I SAM-dependent methyltransferase [Sphingobacteriales bacterium]